VDFRRFYVPYGASREHVHPTRSGVSLRLDEWAELSVLVLTIHDRNQNWLMYDCSCVDSANLARSIECAIFDFC